MSSLKKDFEELYETLREAPVTYDLMIDVAYENEPVKMMTISMLAAELEIALKKACGMLKLDYKKYLHNSVRQRGKFESEEVHIDFSDEGSYT